MHQLHARQEKNYAYQMGGILAQIVEKYGETVSAAARIGIFDNPSIMDLWLKEDWIDISGFKLPEKPLLWEPNDLEQKKFLDGYKKEKNRLNKNVAD